MMSKLLFCELCGITLENMKTCGKCHKVHYCSREHQVQDWKETHSVKCGTIPDNRSLLAEKALRTCVYYGRSFRVSMALNCMLEKGIDLGDSELRFLVMVPNCEDILNRIVSGVDTGMCESLIKVPGSNHMIYCQTFGDLRKMGVDKDMLVDIFEIDPASDQMKRSMNDHEARKYFDQVFEDLNKPGNSDKMFIF